ncbi:Maf family protein [Roseomonas sp. OT10]|uniref:Maf family protein n=1 Tax=Roseomonas cutis TaxID=2897332 RepID=UPI001E2F5A7B|nr:Maf family protein [Roseomonas sp. OT10]UFN48585.1 Maf family protein [Roseomonas sp. OT10]
MLQAETPALVLASASPARIAMLRAAGLRFDAMPAAVDEATIKESAQAEDYPPAEAALLLAEAKAARIAGRLERHGGADALVIGCDQLLTCEIDGRERWFDKPADLAAARAHLTQLRGRTHRLHTAVLCWRGGRRVWQHVATPRLTMRDVSDAVLDAYLAAEGDALLSCVGAYRLEGPGVQLFDRVEGEHSAVLGLPLLPLLGFLRQHGVLPR